MWPALGLVEHLRDVNAYDTQNQQIDAAEENDGDNDGSPSMDGHAVAQRINNIWDIEQREGGQTNTHVGGKIQWTGTERSHASQSKTDHLADRILGFPGIPGGRFVIQTDLFESHPLNESAVEKIILPEISQLGDRIPADKPEIRRAFLDIDIRNGSEHAIEHPGGDLFDHAFMGCLTTSGADDIITLLVPLKHFADQPGRVLQITVHHDQNIRIRVIQPRLDRILMAEIPGQLDISDTIVHTRQILDAIKGVIRTAIIDVQDRELIAGWLQCQADLCMDRPDISGFVMGGK